MLDLHLLKVVSEQYQHHSIKETTIFNGQLELLRANNVQY